MVEIEGDSQRFFREFIPKSIRVPTVEEVFANPSVLSSKELVEVLKEAKTFLRTEPGPNLERRRMLVAYWFDYWEEWLPKSNYYNRFDQFHTAPSQLIRFEELPRYIGQVVQSGPVGITTGAGFEGHRGHRKAIDYIARHAFPVMLLEPDSNFLSFKKQRLLPFLPLSVRLLLWSKYPNVGLVSTVPEMTAQDQENMNGFYQRVIDLLNPGGDVRCFAHQDDPYREIKIRRARYEPTNIIPGKEHDTTDMVGELMSTTDAIRGMSPDINAFERSFHMPDPEDTLEYFLKITELGLYDTLWEA